METISGTPLDRRRRVSDKVREEIIAAYNAGETNKSELARKFNIKRTTINGILGIGTKRKSQKGKKYTQEERRKNRERVRKYRERIKQLKKLNRI